MLNKIKISQEEHEANLKKDLNNLNMNESSISNMLKDGLSTSMKYEYEAELDNVRKIFKIFINYLVSQKSLIFKKEENWRKYIILNVLLTNFQINFYNFQSEVFLSLN